MTESTPMLFEHCSSVYAAMDRDATDEQQVEAYTDEGEVTQATGATLRVYEGHLTKIFSELGLATPYYTSVTRALKAMGCIEQLRRGGGAQTSKWVLVKAPALSDFEDGEGSRPSTLKAKVTFLEKEVMNLKHNQAVIMRHLGVQL